MQRAQATVELVALLALVGLLGVGLVAVVGDWANTGAAKSATVMNIGKPARRILKAPVVGYTR